MAPAELSCRAGHHSRHLRAHTVAESLILQLRKTLLDTGLDVHVYVHVYVPVYTHVYSSIAIILVRIEKRRTENSQPCTVPGQSLDAQAKKYLGKKCMPRKLCTNRSTIIVQNSQSLPTKTKNSKTPHRHGFTSTVDVRCFNDSNRRRKFCSGWVGLLAHYT